MRLAKLSNKLEGKVLGHTIYDPFGRVLLRRGVPLTGPYISRLKRRGYSQVYVQNELAPDLKLPQVISENTRAQATRITRDFAISAVNINDESADLSPVRETVETIMDSLCSHPENVVNLTSIKTIDDYTFEHSVNVCAISLILTREITDREDILASVGTGALLHDIGKLSVPLQVLLKPGPLSSDEYEQVKQHTTAGHNLLKKLLSDPIPSQLALRHHERIDGKGYPHRLRGSEIAPLTRLVSAADVFDAVTSDRVYGEAMKPHQAIELLQSAAGSQLDPKAVKLLSSCLAHYPVGTILRLSTGEIAVVYGQNDCSAARPRVRVVVDAEGEILEQPVQVDLTENSDLSVDKVLDEYPKSVREQIEKRASSSLGG